MLNIEFDSKFEYRGQVNLPEFTGTRVMMLPLMLGQEDTVPEFLEIYKPTLRQLFGFMDQRHRGQVGYLTIDEKRVNPGQTHRRAGLHVDGVFEGKCGSWGGGGWGSVGNGMLTVSNISGCKAYNQEFKGIIGNDGECDLLASQCDETKARLFEPNAVYWVDGLCVHESVPMQQNADRQFVRLSMPSNAPWFEGYTVNPLGVLPTGPILPPRRYMGE